MEVADFWVVAPCSLVEVCRRFGSACCVAVFSFVFMFESCLRLFFTISKAFTELEMRGMITGNCKEIFYIKQIICIYLFFLLWHFFWILFVILILLVESFFWQASNITCRPPFLPHPFKVDVWRAVLIFVDSRWGCLLFANSTGGQLWRSCRFVLISNCPFEACLSVHPLVALGQRL
jgi:hypothetical protein